MPITIQLVKEICIVITILKHLLLVTFIKNQSLPPGGRKGIIYLY